MIETATILIGANSEIAKSCADVYLNEHSTKIIISRNVSYYKKPQFKQFMLIKVDSYTEQNIIKACETIRDRITSNTLINKVITFHGLLHDDSIQPEKRIEDFNVDHFLDVIHVNTLTPLLWLKHLLPIIVHKHECKFVVFSARVGSISDDKTGGWYSYRSSKSELNMLLKSAAIEFSRRAKNIKLISFHPGTTNTPLSKPFQRNVPKGKLFTSAFVAEQLKLIIENVPTDERLSFIDWQGKTIDW